jgi:hypothetical protein
MKKLMSLMLVGLFAFAVTGFAADAVATAKNVKVSVEPNVDARLFNDFKTAAQFGVKANLEQLPVVPSEVVVTTGLDFARTELKTNSAKTVDFYTVPLEVGYNYAVSKDFTVKPIVGLDFIASSSDNATIDNTVGEHLAVEASYLLRENVKVSAEAGYSFASVTVDGQKESLDGLNAGGSVTYTF